MKNITYEEAKHILKNYSTNNIYLKSLIGKYNPDANPDSLDYTALKHEGYKIKGIASKNIKNLQNLIKRLDNPEHKEKNKSIKKDIQLSLF